MSIMPSPEVNAMIFILTGERLIDADEDLAYESRRPYSGLGRKLDRMSSLIDKSVHDIAASMPDDLAKAYSKAMGTLIDDGGRNYLREFSEQLDKIAEGRRKTSMDIMESKWQVIAEVIRLLIEIALYLAMSFFTGGASASQIMMAKLRSRFFILTTLTHLLQRLHIAPSLTEAFSEAFTTFAVRLAMMNFAPDGRRPDGFDWSQILKDAAFGAAAGLFTSILDDFARNIVRSFDKNFLKNGPDLDFKNPPTWRNNPDIDLNHPAPNAKPAPVPTPPPHRDTPLNGLDPTPWGGGPNATRKPPVTFRDDPLSFRNNPALWRNSQLLRHNADRPGALAGHYTLKGTTGFLAAGLGESAAEIVIKGAFEGDWSTSWSTFVGAGLSSQVEATLSSTAVNSGAELRHTIDQLRFPPPTGTAGTQPRDGSGTTGTTAPGTDTGPRTESGGGTGDGARAPGSAGTPGAATLGPPPPYTSGTSTPHTSAPPPYTPLSPPYTPLPATPGPLPAAFPESELWQQVHAGPAEVREQALRDLAALRGTPLPGAHDAGVRGGLHSSLSQVPEIRLVPEAGPAQDVDAEQVRRALENLGTPVTVDRPATAPADHLAGNPTGPGLAAGPGTATAPHPGPGTGREAGPQTDVADGTARAPGKGEQSDTAPGPGAGLGATGAGANTGTGTHSGTGVAANSGAGSGTGMNSGSGTGAGPNSGSGTGAGASSGSGTGAGPNSGPGTGGRPAGTFPTQNGTAPAGPTGQVPAGSGPLAPRDGAQVSPDASPGERSLTPAATDDLASPPRPVTTGSHGGTDVPGDLGSVFGSDGATGVRGGAVGTVGPDGGADVSGEVVKTPEGPAGRQAPPLTVVMSTGPLPAAGSPEAAAMLDRAGTDRAVVLGPQGTPDSAGRPARAAAELTRESPDAPVKARPLASPAPTPAASSTPGTATAPENAFPDADVLLPLADALGAVPDARPATESAAATDTDTPAPSPDSGNPRSQGTTYELPPTTAPVNGGGTVQDTGPSRQTPEAEPGLPPRRDDEPATDPHLESGGPDGTNGSTTGTAAATPPPRVVVRPADGVGPTDGDGDGTGRPRSERTVLTLDGHAVPLDQVRRWAPDPAVQPRPGVAVRTLTVSQDPAEDGTARDLGRRALLGQDSFRGVRTESAAAPASGATAAEASPPVPRTVFTGPATPLPGAGTERGADYFVGHGTPRTVTLGTEDSARPAVRVSGVQLGEVLKSWAADGDEGRPLVLFSCETGRPPRIAGLPVAQHVANRTGRPVHAPTTEVGTARDRHGEVRAVLTEGEDGPGRWRLFTPEPQGADLDQAARDAGLHAGPGPADAFARTRTLQQIRTLREALGPDAEQRPENAGLLAGLAHVDTARWRSSHGAARYGDGRMTPELLRRMVTDWHAATTGPTATEPTTAQYAAFLHAAAEARAAAGPDTTLDTLLPPPPPTPPPTALVSQEDVRGLSYASSAQVAWTLSDALLPLSDLALGPEDLAELARRRPGLVSGPSGPPSLAEDPALFSGPGPTPGPAGLVRADGTTFLRVPARGDGNCLFRSVLDSARGQEVPPAWAARSVDGLRTLVRDRVAGSELGAAADALVADPVATVVDDLRVRALAGVADADTRRRVTERWNTLARQVVADSDPDRWRQLLADSDYPHLAQVAPTPADARRLGGRGLLAAAAEHPGLWSSPFADLLPDALAHTLDLDLRLVRPDPTGTGAVLVTAVHPGGTGGTLHLAYNGTDHYDALVPAPAPSPPPVPDPPATSTGPQDPDGSDPFGEWLRGMDRITDLDAPAAPDRGDVVPLETQLERHRPARLLTGEDARPPGPAPRTVTFEDGSRLPAVLIRPGAGPRDTAPDTEAADATGGLLAGPGVLTLRSPEVAAREILDKLPTGLRDRFDEAELLRLLTDQAAAFTSPRGARLVGREKSGVGLEMTVEAVPYHRWERFSDVDGGTVRVDTMRRGQAGTGGGRSVGFGRRIGAGLSMGPPLSWLLKIAASVGWTRRTDYTQGTSAFHQGEHRGHEGSHLHLDDVHYRVRVERVTEAPPATGTAPPAAGPNWRRTRVHTAEFGMRDGLSWRLPDDFTVPFTGPRRAPETLVFPDGREPRMLDSTGLYLADPPEDVALALSAARPGSSAHRTLVSYVRPGRLLGIFGRLTGPVSGPELTRGSGQHPLGHLVLERSVPHRATLVTESAKVEVRELTQTTYQNQRGHVRETRFGLQVTSGPNHTLPGPETDVRLQGGPLIRTDLAAGRSHHLGTDAARKVTGRVRNHPVALYQVERTLMVRKAGEPASAARPVRVVSLDWISAQDARRLAGWDSRTPGRTGPHPDAEPPVPWYLTREDPRHLGGQVRAEGFRPPDRPQAPPPAAAPRTTPVPPPPPAAQDGTPPQDPVRVFTDSVLDTLHRSYPSLFVPPAMLRHPRLSRLWYGEGRLRTALHNDRQVREALNRPTLTQSLDELATTGVPVTLTEDGKVRRGHHTLTLRARLTDRRFETTLSERSLRNAVVGNEFSGQGQQEAATYSAGVEAGISPRDHDTVPGPDLPRRIGNISVGARHARTYQKAGRSTVTVVHDHLTAQNGADLYSYQVELGASFEGHRRPRGWARLLSLGALGAGVFVSKVEERPLFSRGTETVGRVELAVPAAHGSGHHAPAEPAAPPAAVPPRHLSAAEADQLVDGVRPLPRADAADRRTALRLLSAPHAVLSTEGGPQRRQLMQETAERAGPSWHVTAPGAPVRTALRRAMANLAVAGQLGQYLGPFGSRITGLNGAGPLRAHYLKAVIRGELDNFRVKSDPKAASLESTVGNEHRVVGSSSTVSRTTLGLQGTTTHLQQAPGAAPVSGAYSTALQYAWGRGRGVSQALTRGRNTTLTFAGRMYLVVADAAETVAVRDRWTAAMGVVGTRAGNRLSATAGRLSTRLGRGLAPRGAAAALHRVRDAVMFHLPLQDAIEAGLAPDGLGTGTPRNLGGGYRVPAFLRGRRFPTHPSGQLDASGAAPQLMRRLEKAGVPSHDREQALQRLSPDFLRAHLHELTTDGMSLPVRHRAWSSPHRLPTGGSPGQLRFKLTPVTTRVERLRTGFELEDYRSIARDDARSATQDRGADVTLSAGERTPDNGVLSANPSLQGTAAEQRSGNRTETDGSTAMPNIATTQAHMEVVTSYLLTVTMTDAAGDPLPPRAVAQVGTLNEFAPAGLFTPVGTGDDGALTAQDVPGPERAVRLLTAPQALPDAIADWRNSDDGTGGSGSGVLPFDDRVGSGVLAVDIRGAAAVHDALTLATARADGLGDSGLGSTLSGDALAARVHTARHTPLTALGTAPAQAQEEATSQGGLTAGFREALGPDGSRLPTQASARLFGQSHTADARLYAKMHRDGARLLAVESKPRMEAMRRSKSSDAFEAGITDNTEAAAGTAPLAGTSNAGLTNPGVALPVGGANDSTALKGAADTTLGTHVKVVTDRSMLFAVPVTWLAVAEADHRITDSRPFSALGKARRGPRAAEARTTALIWLREDLARDHGLLDDTTFPDEAAAAWDAMAQAAADLATAEKEYYDARARARESWLALGPRERAALGDDDPRTATVLPRDLAAAPGVIAWQAARDEARTWRQRTDAAAADHHRLHLAASRLTAHHQGSSAVPLRDLPQEYTAPAWRSRAPEPYTVTDASGPAPLTLTSPDGATAREAHAVPHDGASFFHALLAVAQVRGRLPQLLGTGLAARFAAAPGDPAVTAEAVGAARDRLAWALGEDGNEDLLDALALDAADSFTQDELDAAGVVLTPAQQAEFDALGRLPTTLWPTPGQRAALAVAALSRPFADEPVAAGTGQPPGTGAPARRAGDHGGADLLPALAARVLGTPLTVVTGEGRDQLFLPHGGDPAAVDPAADPVLFLADGFFHAALPPGTPAPVATALPAPATAGSTAATAEGTGKPPVHRSHPTAPWLPPADGDGPRHRLGKDGVLTAPDGATYTQGTPTGRGNGFFGALSTALRAAADRPGTDRHEAGRLRLRAGSSPALLMRLNGLPGTPAERDALFAPPPFTPRRGAPTPSAEALEGHLRRHLAEAPWGPGADRALAEWAAAATGTTVTLVEENGTTHTYPGPAGPSGAEIRLRRRGGDFVPLLPRTPAPSPGTTPPPATGKRPPRPEDGGHRSAAPLPATAPPLPSPPAPPPGDTAEPPGLPGEEAYELSTLSGGRDGSGPARGPLPQSEALRRFRFTDTSGSDTSDSDVSDDEAEGGGREPEPTPEAWLDLLFAPALRADHEPAMLLGTAMALRELALAPAGTPGTATGPLDASRDLARRVLGLPRNTPVEDRHFLFLGSLALSAAPADLTDADALVAFLSRHDAALGRDSRLVRGDDAVRNWTGTGAQVPPLDTYAVEGGDGHLSAWPAPWSKPYAVLAQEHGEGLLLQTRRGRITVDAAEFARLVARDPARRPGADVVLAFPHEDIASLARHVAELTGARVWFSEHAPRPSTDWRTGGERVTLGPVPEGTGTVWNSARPDPETDTVLDDLLGLYAHDPEPGSPVQARRPDPLTTTHYGVTDLAGEGVLFTRPGGYGGAWRTPRALEGTEDAPELAMSRQEYHQTLVTERPALRISADRTLAVEDGAYGQQVFATPQAVSGASARLARAGLAVRLSIDELLSVVLPTPDGGARRLYRVTPVFLTRSGRSTEEVCRDFADMLAGTSRTSHLVFRPAEGGQPVTAPANASDGAEVTGTHFLADALAEVADGGTPPEQADPAWAASHVRRDDRPAGGDGGPLPGRAYGSALSLAQDADPRRDALSEAARRIGVNEHAWADIGEGYVVQSVAAPGAQGGPSLERNYAKPASAASGAHFGYHFATVVLASEDGTHQISLENHARASVRAHRHRRAVEQNLRSHDLDELREIAARLRAETERREADSTGDDLKELRGHLNLAYALIRAKQAQTETHTTPAGSPERAAAQRALEGATRAAAQRLADLEPVIPGKDQWYLRMYSRRQGESAHDTNAELLHDRPSAEANPLTAVVVRGQQALPVSVTFAKDDQETPESATHALRHLAKVVARTGLWNAANGLPLPAITVSGPRGARLVGRDLTKARAEAVAASFRRELAAALVEYQDGTPGPHLTEDRFTVEAVSVRGRRSSTGSSGTTALEVTVDDHRGGPRRTATRGLRGGSREDGLDPLAEQWAVGRPVTVAGPRYGGVHPGSVVPASQAPARAPQDPPAGVRAKGKAPLTPDGGPAAGPWFTYTRPAESRSEPFRYEISAGGRVRLPDGEEIPADGWTRFGDDFVHEPTGVLLRGDSGWIGRVANIDTLAPLIADLDPDGAPHHLAADAEALYVVPDDGDQALRIPLRAPGAAVTALPHTGRQEPPRARLDDRPRRVVRGAFDVRRFTHDGHTVTDLTVRLAFREGDGEHDPDTVLARVREGVTEFFNRPGHRLPGGDLLHVTVERVRPDEGPHLTVDLVGRDRPMDQRAWWADADPAEYAHELAHQLALRDETRDASNPRRLHAPGSLLGSFWEQAPEGLAQGGLRPRHLHLWAAAVQDVVPHVAPQGTTWDEARGGATPERREPVWLDPVSLPAASAGTGPDGAVPPPLPGGRDLSPVAEVSDESDSSDDSDTEREPAPWTAPGWLDTVFGPRRSDVPRVRLLETSEALYDLVRTEAGARPGPQALPHALGRVTRRVLHMAGGARPGSADFRLLGSLALDASSDDLASTDDLARYFVERQIETGRGALDEGTLLRDEDGDTVGRDFTGDRRPAPELASYAVRGRGRVVPRPAPWRNPYLIVARAGDRSVEIAFPGRTFRVRDPEELAMLISYDSRRPRGADIVLALPHQYAAGVASLVAGTTGRRVWYPEAPVDVVTRPTAGTRHLLLDVGDGGTGAGWASAEPPPEGGLPGAADADEPDSASEPESDDDRSSSEGDADFDRLADEAVRERQIEARRPRPLITRDYGVIDKRGTGTWPTGPLPPSVGEVVPGTGLPALVLPRQDQGTVRLADRPPLHISEDRTLAMLAPQDGTAGRGRAVYATRAAIARSSARLAAAGAGVRLKADESSGILLPGEDGAYGEPLLRVEPEFLTGSGASEHAFTRDFARMVAGARPAPLSHLAFRGPGGEAATVEVNALHGREVTGTHHLAEALAEAAEDTRTAGALTPGWAARRAGRDPRFTGGVVGAPTPGERYGRALRPTPENTLRAPLAAAARRLGVNEYAWAEVGEGYLIQSVSTTNDSGAQLFTHNHAKPGDRVGPHAPYHLAQAVLASEDGTHQITLENETHSRTGLPTPVLDDIVDENLDRYGEDELAGLAATAERRAGEARRDGADEEPADRLESFARAARALADVHRAEQMPWYFDEDRPEHALALREVADARSRAREAVREAAPLADDKDLWFFRAYSKRPGESAHEANAELLSERSPAVANPLTTVVLHGHTLRADQLTLHFAEEQHTLTGADDTIDALARTLARSGLWNRAHGLPMPAITLTGHGNRSQAVARTRADAVSRALARRLGQVLAESQRGASGTPVAVRDFPLTLSARRTRGATDPARGRVVTVEIDDHRAVPPGTPGRTAPVAAPPRPEEPAAPEPVADTATEPVGPGPEAEESAEPSERARSRSPRRTPRPSPERRNSAAPPWVLARIRYAEESADFDRRLGEYLAQHEAVTAEFRKMASAAWAMARRHHPRDLATFGDTSKYKAGVVGTSREALQRVVRGGNLRELVAFLYEGISSDLVPQMLGGAEEQHPEIAAERPSRRQRDIYAEFLRRATEIQASHSSAEEKEAAIAELQRSVVTGTRPDSVLPPLSEAERRFAVDGAGLTWMPATSVYDIAMSAGFQGRSEDTGGLVATGTAGSTYRFMLHAGRMRDQWGLDLDLGLIRAGMAALSLGVGHHTFHEVMRGAQLALNDIPGHDPRLDYTDNWGRYWNVYPLDERELREHVARDGLFPDEHAQAVLDEAEGRATTGTGATRPVIEAARDRAEDAEARLWALGTVPQTPGAGDAAPGPAAPRTGAELRWLAERLTAEDLPSGLPRPAEGETVGPAELEAAGVTLSAGQRTERELRGDGLLPASALSPLDLARVRLAGQPGRGDTADTVAANVARRLWARAYAAFADTAPDGADAGRVWARAVRLVLPMETRPVLADSRYAGDGFRDAVRRVADHLLTEGAGAASAGALADDLRVDLGLDL
ncbi:hypothetical protein ACFWMQ_22820 [Streptomyces sp. NPDC058372]|uniref:WXG100-like domain-containing protein n=1 Tax=Streptomyces sp. NPDC058372 TaxID=3346464 RepID=UPI003651C58F